MDKHTDRSAAPLNVVDGTGSVRVGPTGADWSLDNDYEHLVEEGAAPTGPHAEFVAKHDVFVFDDEGVSEAHELRFVERRLEPDDDIAVFGPVDDSGLERRIHSREGWFADKRSSIADRRDDLTVTASASVVPLLFGLGFTTAGLAFAWVTLV